MKLKLFMIESPVTGKKGQVVRSFLVGLERERIYDFMIVNGMQGDIIELENEVTVNVAIPAFIEKEKNER